MWKSVVLCASVGLLAAASEADATVIQVVVEATASYREVGHADEQTRVWSYSMDPAFAPQTFKFTAEFDLDNPTLKQPPSSSSMNPYLQTLDGNALYDGGSGPSTSPTPFTDGLLSAFKPEQSESWHTYSTASLSLSTKFNGATFQNQVTPVSAAIFFGSSGQGTTIGDLWNDWTYRRNVNFQLPTNPVSNRDFHIWTSEELLEALTATVGTVNEYGFNEYAYHAANEPASSIAHEGDSVRLWGSTVVKSVTVVPEPSSAVLMGMGLAALIIGSRRKMGAAN